MKQSAKEKPFLSGGIGVQVSSLEVLKMLKNVRDYCGDPGI